MPTRTISIDLEAYDRLKSVQKENESFSQVIKRMVRKPLDLERLLEQTAKDPMSDQAIESVEQVIAARGKTTARRSRGRGAA